MWLLLFVLLFVLSCCDLMLFVIDGFMVILCLICYLC